MRDPCATVRGVSACQDGSDGGFLCTAVPKATDDCTPQVRRRIRYLEELQNKYDELDEEFEEEMRALEKKYRALYGQSSCCACSGNCTSCGIC